MNHQVVKTKNVQAFFAGLEVLRNGVKGRIGLMLMKGAPGTGKTFITQKQAMEDDTVYVRCKYIDKPKSLLQSIVAELGEEPRGHTSQLFNQALDQLLNRPRTLILDEADYMVQAGIIEIIRDLNDMANTPVIISGMENIDKKLQRFPHLVDRIRAIVHFKLFDLGEIKLLGKQVCEANIDDSGYDYIAKTGQGKFRVTNDLFDLAERLQKRSPALKIIHAGHLAPAWEKEKTRERR